MLVLGTEGVKGKVDAGGSVVGACCAPADDTIAKNPAAAIKILRIEISQELVFRERGRSPLPVTGRALVSGSKPRCRSQTITCELLGHALTAGALFAPVTANLVQ
jgi:hypothetical protein